MLGWAAFSTVLSLMWKHESTYAEDQRLLWGRGWTFDLGLEPAELRGDGRRLKLTRSLYMTDTYEMLYCIPWICTFTMCQLEINRRAAVELSVREVLA